MADVVAFAQGGVEKLRSKLGALGAIVGPETLAALGGTRTTPQSPATDVPLAPAVTGKAGNVAAVTEPGIFGKVSVLVLLAVGVGGAWAYNKFFKKKG